MPTTEELDRRIDGVETLLTTKTREISTQILKIDETLAAIPAQIATVVESQKKQNEAFASKIMDVLDAQQVIEGRLKGLSDEQARQGQQNLLFAGNIADLLDDRREFKDLWSAQKRESVALENLRQNQGDPEIQALLSMKGLDVMVSRTEIAKLQGDKDALKAALRKFPDSRGGNYARMLANLGYAYVLMAQNYKISRDHVTAVIAEKTAADIFLTVTLEVLKAAVAAGLSALTAGVTGIISDALVDKAGLAAKTGTLDFQDDDGKTHKTEVTEKEDPITGRKIGAAVVSSPVESGSGLLGGGLDSVVGNIGGLAGFVSRASQLFSTDTPENTTMEPYEFFIEKEAQLRRAAAMVASCTDPAVLKEIKVQLDREYSLEELENDPNWKYFFAIHSNYKELNEIWEMVGALLAANMRRLCWRLFCRSQWNNVKYSYTITVEEPAEAEKISSKEAPATEWNYKNWAWSGLGWPRHWEKICSDFRGPEHDPDHKFTVEKGLVNKAHKLLESNAWISMAAVQCCQVKRYDTGGISQNWAIDLEKYGHIGGEEGTQHAVPNGLTDWELVYGDIRDTKYKDPIDTYKSYLEEFIQKIRVHSGTKVQIFEIRFGKGGEDVVGWTKATGKKGKLALPNSPDSAIPIVKGMKITALIKRTSSQGNVTSSKHRAMVQVFKALKDKHDGTNACEKVLQDKVPKQLCWYCQNSTRDEIASDAFKEKYKLKQVDEETQKSRIISNVEVSYVNFPSANTRTYVSEPGLYCIKLDPRKHLQTMDDGEFHLTDEWWFKVLDKANPDQAPNVPTIPVKPVRGAKELAGKYARRATDPNGKTLIHVFVNDKMYGPTEIDYPPDTNAVDWKVECTEALRGGEKIYATATWAASGTESARQSDPPPTAVVVEAAKPDLHVKRLLPGATFVSGVSDAAPGSTIRVYVADIVNEGTPTHAGEVKLLGEPFDQAEVKNGNVVVTPEKKGVIRWQVNNIPALVPGKKVAARVVSFGAKASPLSDVASVTKTSPPVIKPMLAGATFMEGTADSVGGLQIRLALDDVYYGSNDIQGPRNDAGQVTWNLGKNRPFPMRPGVKLTVQVGIMQQTRTGENWIACSDPTSFTVPKVVTKPEVDQVMPGYPITGTATLPDSLVPHAAVWVMVDGNFLSTKGQLGEPDGSGKVTWEFSPAPPLKPGTSKVRVQVFANDVGEAEYTDLSDEVTVDAVDDLVIGNVALNAESISGTGFFVLGASIQVKVGGKEMQHAAEITPKTAKPGDAITWKLTKLKPKGAKASEREKLTAGKKIEAAIFIGTQLVSTWVEKTL